MTVRLDQTTWHGTALQSPQQELKISHRISRTQAFTASNVTKLSREIYKKIKIITLFYKNVAAELSEHPAQTVVIVLECLQRLGNRYSLSSLSSFIAFSLVGQSEYCKHSFEVSSHIDVVLVHTLHSGNTETLFYLTTHIHSSLRLFHVTAESTPPPVCCELWFTHFSSIYCS